MRNVLIALYPEAWRRRYASEMHALLEDNPPGPRATVDLLRGAVVAHLHPLDASRPRERARNSVSGVLGCFICLCFLGGAFAKTTEDLPFQAAGRTHPLIGVTHGAVLLAAIAAAVALLLAALPLAGAAFAEAGRTRDRDVLRLIAAPPLVIGLLVACLGALAAWLDHNQHRAGVIGWALLVLCGLVAVGAAGVCWLAPRAIMRRVEPGRRELVLAVPALSVVTLCMLIITTATGAYLVALVLDAPGLAAEGNGPGQLVSTWASVSVVFVGMLALSAMATLSAARGVRAVRAL